MASEASATPLCSYAPQSNFSALRGVSAPWTPGIQMLSSPDFPLPACAETFAHAANRHQEISAGLARDVARLQATGCGDDGRIDDESP